jgi:hypothetical protein
LCFHATFAGEKSHVSHRAYGQLAGVREGAAAFDDGLPSARHVFIGYGIETPGDAPVQPIANPMAFAHRTTRTVLFRVAIPLASLHAHDRSRAVPSQNGPRAGRDGARGMSLVQLSIARSLSLRS